MIDESIKKDIVVVKINEVWMHVICKDAGVERSLSDYMTYESEQAKFRKNKKWDGRVRLYNKQQGKLYVGLVSVVYDYAKRQALTIDIDPRLMVCNKIVKHELEEFIQENFDPRDGDGDQLLPYDYQIDAIHHAYNYNRSTLLSATSSGKSLILYCLSRLYELSDDIADKSILILVPNVNLVEQLYSDFEEYSNNGLGWKTVQHCQKITADYVKNIHKKIVISTWQSIYKFSPDFFDQFGAVLVDETHRASAECVKNILENMPNVAYRHGMTGTLQDAVCNQLIISGLLGHIKTIIKSHQLQEAGRASQLMINTLILKYKEDECKDITSYVPKNDNDPTEKYRNEQSFLHSHERRNKFIHNLALSKTSTGNTLIISDRIDTHLVPMYEKMKEIHNKCYIIVGTGDYKKSGDEKEAIRKELEHVTGALVFCSYGTMSTGVSIKNLHNIILAGSIKAKVTILQTIGRLLRLHHSKMVACLYDLVDDLSYKGKENTSLRQGVARLEQYYKEKYKVKFFKLDI